MAHKPSKPKASVKGELIRKVRKPMAPPVKIETDERKYRRTRERAKVRRQTSNQ